MADLNFDAHLGLFDDAAGLFDDAPILHVTETALAASIQITGVVPTVTANTGVTETPSAASALAVTGLTASISIGFGANPTTSALEILGQNPTVSTDQMISVGVGASPVIGVSGASPSLTTDNFLSAPGASALEITGLTATSSVDYNLAPLTGVIKITGLLAFVEVNIGWPISLPQVVSPRSFTMESTPSVAVTSLQGKRRVRQRQAQSQKKYKVSLDMTAAQVSTFKDWYVSTGYGCLRFVWVDPFSGDAGKFRVSSPPEFVPKSPIEFSTTFDLERVA